ncbi:hypothetical protein KEM56_005294 [Ascosphaera pollenicola]|nr:hypothetical protein KEM56_005294 [Ascosphaera pollenicola]
MDARALASPNLTVLLAGNKADLSSVDNMSLSAASSQDGYSFHTATDNSAGSLGTDDYFMPASSSASASSLATARRPASPTSTSSEHTIIPRNSGGNIASSASTSLRHPPTNMTATASGREVSPYDASYWAAASNIPVAVEVSALTGEGVDELFNRLARIILTKIELGEIDPDDPQSGIQYGDSGFTWDGGSTRSGGTMLDDMSVAGSRRRRRNRNRGSGSWATNVREWEEVFRVNPRSKRNNCC